MNKILKYIYKYREGERFAVDLRGRYSDNFCNFGPESRNEILRKLLKLAQLRKFIQQNSTFFPIFFSVTVKELYNKEVKKANKKIKKANKAMVLSHN